MTDALYDAAKQAFLQADIDMLVDDIRVLLVDTGLYTFNPAHTFLTSVPAGARVATSNPLAAKTSTAGRFDAADGFVAATVGISVEAVILYQHTGVDGTSRLIGYLDSLVGLPITPSNVPINIVWGAYIFSIADVCP